MSAEILDLAREAARAAGDLLLARVGRPASGLSAKTSRTDLDRKSTRLNSSHIQKSRMPSSA